MGTFKLSLPTDIPWRRICVSKDMLDEKTCNDERPPRWRSSMAAFRYDPAEEYQPFENEVISYIKVVATIAPFQETEIETSPIHGYLPPELIDDVEESFPCYGAVIQVNVGPTAAEKANFKLEQYPYFIDFEPKKRELYEAVTETGEVLTGSLNNLSIGKAATDTHSTEDYSLDLGGGGGFSIGYMGMGLSANWDDREQTGTVARANHEVSNMRTTDFSTERREVQSHTTSITQMYNLFQAFHLGTNRGLFLLEPRPHIRQTESTFINGPRALEGIQEVFLIVVRPKEMQDFCISALLEMAHLTHDSASHTSTDLGSIHAEGSSEYVEEDEGGSFDKQSGTDEFDYTPPAGWEIDTSKSGGYKLTNVKKYNANTSPTVQVDPKHLHMEVAVPWNGKYQADIIIYLRTIDEYKDGKVYKLFISARELCCCPQESYISVPWIPYDIDWSGHGWGVHRGMMSKQTFLESRLISSSIHKELIRSFTSSRRQPHGAVFYGQSDVFHTRITGLLRASRYKPLLNAPLANAQVIDADTLRKLERAFGTMSAGDYLRTDAHHLVRVAGSDIQKIGQTKQDILRWLLTQNDGAGTEPPK